jgi:hypothetical protein
MVAETTTGTLLACARRRAILFLGLEGTSDRLFGVSKIEALEAVESSIAVLHAVIQYGNAVLDLGRIGERELQKKPELRQLVEKKGKHASSIARIICRTENRLDRVKLQR